MEYNDYVQVYDVMDSAGIESTDTRATQVSKIAEWINGSFGDMVTAVTKDDTKVFVYDNSLRVGFAWGNCYATSGQATSYTNCRYGIYSGGTAYETGTTSYASGLNVYTISTLKLFVCKTSYGYIFDFIRTSAVGHYNNPRFIVATGTDSYGNSTKLALVSDKDSTSSTAAYLWSAGVTENTTASTRKAQETFMGINNTQLQRTILTKYAPPGGDIITDGLYRMMGVLPPSKSIFELNGSKYLSLNYYDYGNGCALALKLD
jgi:hypothetical protein